MDFWKLFFMQCVTQLLVNENILQFEIRKCTVYKVIVSQKKESTLNHWNESFLKRMLKSTWNISILPSTCWSFRVGLNENANSFFATRCSFWSCKNSCFPGNAVHKAALRSQTLLYQALQVEEMEMRSIDQSPQISVTQRRGLEKWIVEWIIWESLNK